MTFRPFSEARDYVRALKLENREEWYEYCKSGKKPDDISARQDVAYKKEWKGWGDWLGTGTVATFNRRYRQFNKAKKFVRSLGLKSNDEWREYCNSGKKPADLPYNPDAVYKKEWTSWGDWLGTGRIANRGRVYRPFAEAREFVHKLGLRSVEKWHDYCI